MASNKKYWKSVEELREDSPIIETLRQNEFVEEIPTDDFLGDKEALSSSSTSRRDFLKFVGFSTAAASLAACEGPVIKSIPYVIAPDEIVPGVANYYATTMADGFDFANVLVKTREGRPIKIERNEMGPHSDVNARVQASVLSLYDKNRLQYPMIDGAEVSWADFDQAVAAKLDAMAGQDVVLLTRTFASPSVSKLIADFTAKYPNVRQVVYDTVSSSEAVAAFQAKYGERGLAHYDFSKAEVIVSVGADFLGDWQGGGYESGYSKGRVPKNGRMSKHIQFESNMTLSGANADNRIPLKPSQQMAVLSALTGGSTGNLPAELAEAVSKARAQLSRAGSKGVIITGLADLNAQRMVLDYNQRVGSVAMDASKPRLTSMGNSAAVTAVMNGVMSGSVKGLITVGVDPVYSFPSADFAEAYKKLDMRLAFSTKLDATAEHAQMVAAMPHYLESWGDLQLQKGHYSLVQPTIRPLFNTRQFEECLLKWTGNDKSVYDYIRSNWENQLLGGVAWNKVLHDGSFSTDEMIQIEGDNYTQSELEQMLEESNSSSAMAAGLQGGGYELTLYTKTSMGDGQQANNPWLQEMPDPLTRASWDNYLTVSAADAAELGLENYNVANGALNGSYANISVDGTRIENVPVLIQPGQAKGSVGLALGYGKTAAIQKEMQTGVNAYRLYKGFKPVQNVTIEKAAGVHEFACVQLHNTMMGRDIIRETTLEIFNTKDVEHWNPIPMVSKDHQEIPVTSPDADLWTEFDRSIGHHFNLSIDLNACTGCGACVIACHAENNVPVVGKEEVRKSRDMHWLRIDRYYSSEESFADDTEKKNNISGLSSSLSEFGEMEQASANPQVAFQPVMCQHCNHAPCETVCPVAATSHGRQGQNHMAYNRCVGTRYCANNCPYKVRRFNWFLYAENDEFDYHMNNDLGRMVLNPDVVVRSRGVMEKCSMCIQMTQKTILDAKRDGRAIKDGEFKTACSAACNSGAITFGDINDKSSDIYKRKHDKRSYHLLEAVGTEPNVVYQTKVRNTNEA
jgi:molybdopterin-containing oxidoreductase family iron-sulfur binding subunit